MLVGEAVVQAANEWFKKQTAPARETPKFRLEQTMELDANKLIENAIRDGMRDGIKAKLTGYNSELEKVVNAAVANQAVTMRRLLEDSISQSLATDEFRQQIRDAVHHNLAKTLIQRFGGEIEKQVNVLKSDPTTRARITLAIEEIVKAKT